jgi:ABC-type cobalamin transport system permease subunit
MPSYYELACCLNFLWHMFSFFHIIRDTSDKLYHYKFAYHLSVEEHLIFSLILMGAALNHDLTPRLLFVGCALNVIYSLTTMVYLIMHSRD